MRRPGCLVRPARLRRSTPAPEVPSGVRWRTKAVGFRNVLVHDYIEVNDSIVVDRLKSLGDLEEFVRQVAAYVIGEQLEP